VSSNGLAEVAVALTSRELQSQFRSVVLERRATSNVVDISDLSPADTRGVGFVTRDDTSHILFTNGLTGGAERCEENSIFTMRIINLSKGTASGIPQYWRWRGRSDRDPKRCEDNSILTMRIINLSKGMALAHGSIIESLIGSHDRFGPLDGRVFQFANYTLDVGVSAGGL
jgi:hypothetical protein